MIYRGTGFSSSYGLAPHPPSPRHYSLDGNLTFFGPLSSSAVVTTWLASEYVSPLHLGPGGGVTDSLAGEGVVGPNSDERRDTVVYSISSGPTMYIVHCSPSFL
jgi:hypothetical protein